MTSGFSKRCRCLMETANCRLCLGGRCQAPSRCCPLPAPAWWPCPTSPWSCSCRWHNKSPGSALKMAGFLQNHQKPAGAILRKIVHVPCRSFFNAARGHQRPLAGSLFKNCLLKLFLLNAFWITWSKGKHSSMKLNSNQGLVSLQNRLLGATLCRGRSPGKR